MARNSAIFLVLIGGVLSYQPESYLVDHETIPIESNQVVDDNNIYGSEYGGGYDEDAYGRQDYTGTGTGTGSGFSSTGISGTGTSGEEGLQGKLTFIENVLGFDTGTFLAFLLAALFGATFGPYFVDIFGRKVLDKGKFFQRITYDLKYPTKRSLDNWQTTLLDYLDNIDNIAVQH